MKMKNDNNRHKDYQHEYFSNVEYRKADDIVSLAYAIPKIDFIRRMIKINKESSILDLACGNGVFSIHWSKISKNLICLDYSENLLKDNQIKDRLICGDAEKLPFKDNSFDMVFAGNLLHHTSRPIPILSEMKRVTKDKIVIIEPNCYNPLIFVYCLYKKAERGGLKSSKKRLISLLNKLGINILAIKIVGMISQNKTPRFLIPLLKRFDNIDFALNEYIIIIAKK